MTKIQTTWVIIPAAGVGKRMATDTPKQYLTLNNKTILEHTLSIFDAHNSISEIILVVSQNDEYWKSLDVKLSKPLHLANGGKERCDSVLNGLKFLEGKANDDDWVLVHDAARPCLRHEDLTLILESLQGSDTGGILAIPVKDTMKRSNTDNKITETVSRENLWHALTPQMFRFGLLKHSIELALNEGEIITDESSAVEFAGYHPILVEGHADNLKITQPGDLALAAYYLIKQKEEH